MHAQGGVTGAVLLVTITGSLGAVLAVMTLRFDRLGPAVLTHVFFNTSGVVLGVLAASS
jgi:membrane protease YdiL (CAAX protease family)